MAPRLAEDYAPKVPIMDKKVTPSTLTDIERMWRDQQSWLKERGYLLRPRFRPDWVPSWTTGNTPGDYSDAEDVRRCIPGPVMDATRISDGAYVLLKHVYIPSHPHEVEIMKYLSSDLLKSDPRNRCVPLLESFVVPDYPDDIVLVLPFLKKFNKPRFETFGEAMSAFTQIFESLQFMHEHNIAHRDCTAQNIMMDATPMYPHPWHPAEPSRRRDWKGNAKAYTRTQRPVKYYLIDFGLSERFNPNDGPPLSYPSLGGDKSVPEQVHGNLCNPFQTDVYYIGNVVRVHFMEKYHGFEFMKPLIADMVQAEMDKRPTMDEVVTRFQKIRDELNWWKLRSRLVSRKEWSIVRPWRAARHWYLTATDIATGKAAIPEP